MGVEQDPIHRHKDVLAHTIAVVGKTEPDCIVRLAALLHDIGKPKTRSIGPRGVSFHHHEVVGARMARDRMRALRYPNDARRATWPGWSTCTCASTPTERSGPTRPSAATSATPGRCSIGSTAHPLRLHHPQRRQAQALAGRMDELERRIAELREQEELDAIRPDLDGRA